MDIEVKIVARDNIPANDRKSLVVETHHPRGDGFNVAKVDQALEGDTVVFRIPVGGRLLFTSPEGEDDVVYDPAQGAAVRRSQQNNAAGVADDAKVVHGTGDPTAPGAREMTAEEKQRAGIRPNARATTTEPVQNPTKLGIDGKPLPQDQQGQPTLQAQSTQTQPQPQQPPQQPPPNQFRPASRVTPGPNAGQPQGMKAGAPQSNDQSKADEAKLTAPPVEQGKDK